MNFINTILAGVISVAMVFGGLFSPQLRGVIPVPVASFTTSLASKITSTDTSMTLVSTSTDDGTNLTNGSVYGFVLDANTADEEYVSGTASSSNIVSMTRGVSVITGNTEVSALKKSHRRGASVKIADAPTILVISRILNGDETIPNQLQYASSSASSTSAVGSSLLNIPNVAYVNSVATSGSPDASEIAKGLVELGTQAQLINGSGSGDSTASLVPQNKFFNATSSATTTVPVTNSSGKISNTFIATSSDYEWTGNQTFTGTTTISGSAAAPYLVPVGTIEAYVSSTAPTGWLLANGQLVSTTTYSSLFSLIGYGYGGSTSTFGVPDLGGRVIISPSSSIATSIGSTGGSFTAAGTVNTAVTWPVNVASNGASYLYGASGASNNYTGVATSTAIPPYMILQYIIKY